MRRALVAAGVAAVLVVAGATVVRASADSVSVDCAIAENVLSCPLPAPVTVTESATVTETADPATETVTETAPAQTVTVTAAPTSSTPTPTPTPTGATARTTAPPPSGACDRTATSASTLTTQVSQATAGQTICLAAGSYGTWGGTNKAITIRAESGVVANMKVSLSNGDAGFTLDGLSGMGGVVTTGAKNFTIRGSTFTSSLDLQGQPGSNILIEGNRFDWPAKYNGGINAKLFVYSGSDGASSGATIRGNSFRNGDLDGIHIGGSAGADVVGNTFVDLCASNTNHTDMLQTEGMVGGRIAQNLFKAGLSCEAQALTSYDSGTVGVVIEDNVVDIRRPWGIEWYSDKNSIIRFNTVVYYPGSQCNFNTPCGRIDINRKSADPAGIGTQATSNLATVEFNAGSTGTSTGNVSSQGAVFVGPLDTWAGYKLAPGSPGQGAGARIP